MTTENATPNGTEPVRDDDVLHAWIAEHRPTRHRLGERPGIEVPATRMTGGHLSQTVAGVSSRRLSTPGPSLLARLLGGAQ